jgi:two-component system chemotaxis sensor kinase CheA
MSTTDDFFDKTEFVQYFRDETEELLQTIDSDLLRLERYVDGPIDVEIVNALFRGLHTIKGSAGMLDFKDVQEVAHKLENIFDLLRKERMPLTEGCINLLFEGRDILTDLVHAAVDDGAVPTGVTEFIARLDKFAAIYENVSAAIEGKRPEAGAEEAEARAPVNLSEADAFEAEVARLLAAAAKPAAAAAPAAAVMAPQGSVVAPPGSVVAPPGSVVAPPGSVVVPPVAAIPPATIVVPPAAVVAPAAVAAPAAAVPAAILVPSAGVAAPPPPPKPADPAETETAKRPPAAFGAAGRNQTIRVDIDRLDLLLNLVGELVINRTRISDIAGTLARNVNAATSAADVSTLAKDLAESSALLARTTNDIQESIMKVRMVPIGGVFERFPRMVRDLAKARGKEVALEIKGGDTDLDKTIVDEVGEPLMHLVRNCVDHGIESPDVREAAGKPRLGELELNAYHEGNQVIIEVSDDGAGIALDKVRARAIKNGMIKATDHPTEREIIDFIFAPGFSTAEKVTDISGRGVGMEIVKKNIAKLKGAFEVETVVGKGTKFTIKLPLTLAIIQALLVRVADELYSIPLDAVIESQRIGAADVRTVHGGEVITLRGQVVPLIRIGEFFELGNPRDPDKVMIVIVGVQGRQVGLVVDSFQGEQEIVIKPLSDVIGAIAGISGATILGNGSISLILDVHSLVSTAHNSRAAARQHLSGVA